MLPHGIVVERIVVGNGFTWDARDERLVLFNRGAHRVRGTMDEAERAFHEALAILDRGGAGDVRTSNALLGLGRVFAATDRKEEARPLLERALEARSTVYGANHPRTVAARRALDEVSRPHE